jgi:hypothetical protein
VIVGAVDGVGAMSPNTKPPTLLVSVAFPETVLPEKSVPAVSPVMVTGPLIRLPRQSPVAGSPIRTGAVAPETVTGPLPLCSGLQARSRRLPG